MSSRDEKIRIRAESGEFSIKMPTCGKAYLPKMSYRRPGNLILGTFLLFLILLFGGLAFAEEQQGYGTSYSNPLCSKLREDALEHNELAKRSEVMGFEILGEDSSCSFFVRCEKGYPGRMGCVEGNATVSPYDFYFSTIRNNEKQGVIPLSDHTDVCSINMVQIKQCQRVFVRQTKILFYGIQGYSGYYLGQHSLVISPFFSDLEDFKCSGEKSKRCNGDEIFKNLFSQSGADEECYCSADTNKTVISLKIGENVYKLDYAFYADVKISYNAQKEEDLRCIGCEITCINGQLAIDYDSEVEMTELCSGRFCVDVRPARAFTVPLSLAAMDHSYHYYIRFADNKEMSGTVHCKIEDLCPLIDCHLCYEKLKNPDCYNFVDKFNFLLVIATMFLLLAIIVKAMKLVWYVSAMILGLFYAIFKVCLWVFKKILQSLGMKLIHVTESYQRIEEQNDGTTKKTETKSKKYAIVRKPQPTYIKTIVILCILGLLSICDACSDTQMVDSKMMDCNMENGNLHCSLKSTAVINVAPVGQQSCFVFQTPDGHNSGTITIETISLDLLCNKEVLYWTFDAKNTFSQKCYCAGSISGHGSEEECNEYNKNSKCKTPLDCPKRGLITSGCRTVKGGWEQGCFSYSSAYCYYSVDIQNVRTTNYEVSRCSSFYWQANIRVLIQTTDGDTVLSSKLNPGNSLDFPGGSLSLVGASVPPMPILQSCFIRSSLATYVSDCQKGGGIMKGSIGEIQCTRRDDAVKPNPSGCSFAKTIHDVFPQGGSLRMISSLMQPRTLTKRLPLTSGGYVIKESGGTISASLNYISLMTLKLNLKNLKLIPYSMLPKCTVKFVSVKGCVSCLPGAVVTLRVKTDDGNGRAVLSCPSLKADIPFTVKKTEEIKALRAHFSGGLLNEICMIKCPGNTIDVKIDGNLISDVQISRTLDESLLDITETASSWMKSLFGQFSYSLLLPSLGVLIIGSVLMLSWMFQRVSPNIHQKKW